VDEEQRRAGQKKHFTLHPPGFISSSVALNTLNIHDCARQTDQLMTPDTRHQHQSIYRPGKRDKADIFLYFTEL